MFRILSGICVVALGVSGSRMKYWGDGGEVFLKVYEELCRLIKRYRINKIIHGCNYRSIDLIADLYARSHNIGVEYICPRNWTRTGLRRRNREIVKKSDIVVCFFVNGVTPGTAHTCREAVKSRKTVEIYLI